MKLFFALFFVAGLAYAQFSPPLSTVQPRGGDIVAYELTSNGGTILQVEAHLESLNIPNGGVVAVVIGEAVVFVASPLRVERKDAMARTYLAMAREQVQSVGTIEPVVTTSMAALPSQSSASFSSNRVGEADSPISIASSQIVAILDDGQAITSDDAIRAYRIATDALEQYDCTSLTRGQFADLGASLNEVQYTLFASYSIITNRYVGRSIDLTPFTRCIADNQLAELNRNASNLANTTIADSQSASTSTRTASPSTSSSTASSGLTDTLNCGDFGSQEEAQELFQSLGGTSNDVHRLDNNNNGQACETFNY